MSPALLFYIELHFKEKGIFPENFICSILYLLCFRTK